MAELLQPHVLLYLAMLVGLVALWRTRPAVPRWRLLCLTVPFVLLSLLCVPAVAYLVLGSLEWSYAPLRQRPADADAIVVLAGYVQAPDEVETEPLLGVNTLQRCLRAAELYHQGPRCPVLVSGGSVAGGAPGLTCAGAMRDFL